jgi:CheY-like chemotaxis protein
LQPIGWGAAVAKSLTYADAVKLLGGNDSKTVAALDKLAGGLLLAASAGGSGLALGLFGVKGELSRLSMALVSRLSDKLRGLSRFARTERLAGAQALLVVVAFFDALEEFEDNAEADDSLPYEARALMALVRKRAFGKADQIGLMTGNHPESSRLRSLARGLLHDELPIPKPQVPYEVTLRHISDLYGSLSAQLPDHVVGAELWEQQDPEVQRAFRNAFQENVSQLAVGRYEELFGRLAAEFPELAFWANLIDHQATRGEIRSLQAGLAGLEVALAQIATGRLPDDRRDALARFYRAALDGPIVETGELPADGLRIPVLGDAYVNPRFQVADAGPRDSLDLENWWDDRSARDDVQGFLLGYLTSPQAVAAPLVLLGQPGSGKSVLTKVLAARLPAREFLAVRVVLREVPADVDLQTQIEHAIRDATGDHLAWPDLVRTAGDALPVVLLDGFDELVQATGVSQSDYLEKITQFQQREAVQGRPVAVAVTSRTAVADRVRIPAGGVVAVRLAPFSDEQVAQWLQVWNDANTSYLARHDLRALASETVLRDAELARQPLLLLMLALYDADDNALQASRDDLGHAQLYERLLTRFAEREVRKTSAGLGADLIQQEIERELLRLSIAAFAMFNRNRQWATESELSTDLDALLDDYDRRRVSASGFRASLTVAQIVIGQFFFVHQTQAIRDNAKLTTCEFLHATFGEYLVARLVTRELDDLARVAQQNAERTRVTRPDDTFIHALLSFTALSARATTIEFLSELIALIPEDRRTVLRGLLLELFHAALAIRGATQHDAYEPVKLNLAARGATYSANLLILAVLVGGPVTGRELFPVAEDVIEAWRRHALLWKSQLSHDGWTWLAATLDFHRAGSAGNRDVLIASVCKEPPDRLIDPYWSWDEPSPAMTGERLSWIRTEYRRTRREGYFLCDVDQDAVIHTLDPLAAGLLPSITTFAGYWDDRCVSAAHALVRLWVASAMPASSEELVAAYDDCIEIALKAFAPFDTATQTRYQHIILRQLDRDRSRLPGVWREKTRQRLSTERKNAETADYADRIIAKLGFPPPKRG